MRRAISAALLAVTAMLGVIALQVTPATAAPAQDLTGCFPGDGGDYPPTGPAVAIEASLVLLEGHFVPGGGSHVVIGGATEGEYCGLAFSTVFKLPLKAANAEHKLVYDNVATPANFELGAMHHIDVYKRQVKVGNFDFCVDLKGDLAPVSACNASQKPGKHNPLPKTGDNHLMDLLRLGVVLIGVGTGMRYLRKRQQQKTA